MKHYDAAFIVITGKEEDRNEDLKAAVRFMDEAYPDIVYPFTKGMFKSLIQVGFGQYDRTLSSSSKIAKVYEETRGFNSPNGDRYFRPSEKQFEAICHQMRPVRVRRVDNTFTLIGNKEEGFKVLFDLSEVPAKEGYHAIGYRINIGHNGYLPRALWPEEELQRADPEVKLMFAAKDF